MTAERESRALVELIKKELSLTDQATEAIRKIIVSGEWEPDEVHSVLEVSTLLGVSRTPAREALLQLAREGLIVFERSVGFRVRTRTSAEIAEIFHMRMLLESPAAASAAVRNDPRVMDELTRAFVGMSEAAQVGDAESFMRNDLRFHEVAIGAAGNHRLVETVQRLREATASLGAPMHSVDWTLADIAEEHRPILNAIKSADPLAAERSTRLHIAHAATILLGWSNPGNEGTETSLAQELRSIAAEQDGR